MTFTTFNLKSLFTVTLLASSTLLSTQAFASLSSEAATPSQLQEQAIESAESQSANHYDKVMSAYSQWAGTRYRLGGNSHAGIDCSAFTQNAMRKAFGLELPRTTSQQKSIGKSIQRADLRPGDLVFFRNNHHVGIYVGDGKFAHASTSKGVTISSLSENYWARTYTQSRRVI